MALRRTIGNKTYALGKTKSTGLFTIWEQTKTGYKIIHQSDNYEAFKSYILHLRDLADQRTARLDIADICGSSFRSAMRDMGR